MKAASWGTGTKELMNTIFKQMLSWSGYGAVKFASKFKWSQQEKKILWTLIKKDIFGSEGLRHLAYIGLNTTDQNVTHS